MPSPVQTVALACHPRSESRAVRSVEVRVARTNDGLAIAYSVAGDLARVRVPPPRVPRIAERLWEHTCCEAFIAEVGRPAYHEFNLAPSGEWAVFAFTSCRNGAPLADEGLDPRIVVRSDANGLVLDASIRLGRLAPPLARARLALALSAVIEDDAGAISYWALKHQPGKPDFHHPEAFALVLDEVRD